MECVWKQLCERIENSARLSNGRIITPHARTDDKSMLAFSASWPSSDIYVSVLCGIDPQTECSFWYGGFHYRRDQLRTELAEDERASWLRFLQMWRAGLLQKERIRATGVEVLLRYGEQATIYPYLDLEQAWTLIFETISARLP